VPQRREPEVEQVPVVVAPAPVEATPEPAAPGQLTAARIVASTSALVGQISRRYTGAPRLSTPTGSVVRSTVILPASA